MIYCRYIVYTCTDIRMYNIIYIYTYTYLFQCIVSYTQRYGQPGCSSFPRRDRWQNLGFQGTNFVGHPVEKSGENFVVIFYGHDFHGHCYKNYWFNGHNLEHSQFWDKAISEDEGSAHFSLVGLKLNQ